MNAGSRVDELGWCFVAGLRILHTADVHLDWLFEAMPLAQKRHRRDELEKGFSQLLSSASSLEVDALLVCGDLFHASTASNRMVAFARRELERLTSSGVEVVLLPGNHDPAGFRAYASELAMDDLHIFRMDKWDCIHLRCGLEVWGRAWTSPEDSRLLMPDLHEALRSYGPGDGLRVVMHHGQAVSGPSGFSGSYRPFTSAQLEGLGASYVALGHVHKAGTVQIPGSDLVARYSGSPFRLSFGEASPRTVSLVTLTRWERADFREIEVIDRGYACVSFDLSVRTLEEVVASICAMADPELCLQVTLTGVVVEGEASPRELVLEAAWSRFFHLEVIDRTLSLALDEGRAAEGTVRGAFTRNLQSRLADEALPERERRIVQLALRLGLSSLRGGGGR